MVAPSSVSQQAAQTRGSQPRRPVERQPEPLARAFHYLSHLRRQVFIEQMRVMLARDARIRMAKDEREIVHTAATLQPTMPEVRIIDDDLWRDAHAEIAKARGAYQKATGGLRGGRPRIDSKYLLVGFARCAYCHGNLSVRTASTRSGPRRRRRFFYSCGNVANKGPGACPKPHPRAHGGGRRRGAARAA